MRVLVKTAGVCGTDLHIWHDEFTYYPPVVLGHEFAGIAKELGADYLVNVEKEDPVAWVLELTDGAGADLVIETSGAPPAIAQAVEMVRTCGRMSLIGLPKDDRTPIAYKAAMLKAIDMHFNMSSSYTAWEKAIKLISRDGERLRSVVTEVKSLDEWEAVFRSMEKEESVKPVFVF